MIIKKMSGTLAVVAVLLGMNSVAMADCDSAILSMQGKANELKGCGLTGSDTDTLVYNDLIWKYKGSPDCAVNYKLARSLYVERIEGGIPPKTKKGKPTHAGAANDFAGGKYEAGQEKLASFIDTLMYGAKTIDKDAQDKEDDLVEWAMGVQTEAMDCQFQ